MHPKGMGAAMGRVWPGNFRILLALAGSCIACFGDRRTCGGGEVSGVVPDAGDLFAGGEPCGGLFDTA